MGARRVVSLETGVDLSFLEWGVGEPTVLLVHGAALSAGAFTPAAEALAGEARVLAVDLRGHGGSSAPADPRAYEMEAMAADLVAFVDALGLRRVVCFAHSLGGGLVLLAALARPDALDAGVLFEGAIGRKPGGEEQVEDFVASTWTRPHRWADRSAAATDLASNPMYRRFDRAAFEGHLAGGLRDTGTGVESACSARVEEWVYRASAAPTGADALIARLPDVAALDVRWTVVSAERGLVPDPWAGRLAAAMGARHERWPGGHMAPFEHPDLVVRGVRHELAVRAATR